MPTTARQSQVTYLDTVRTDGTYDLGAIMAIAVASTHREVEGYARIGRQTTFRKHYVGQIKIVLRFARSIRASLMAGRERASLSPTERRARTLEQQAEIAEGAIPSRRADAMRLRSQAFDLRLEATQRLIAAE